MRRRYGERAVTVQIGAILLLAIVFTALALYQVNAVPAENQAVEIDHNRQVTNELQDVRNAIGTAGFGGSSRSASVTLGTSYPTRTFLTNPPDPTGRLETTDPGPVTITDSNDTVYGPYETRFLAYEPDYNEYRDAPRTVIEHSLLYNQFDEANVSVGSQQLVGSERISLVLLDGNVSETSGRATSVSLESLDEPRTKELEAGSVLTLPTERKAIWESELEDTDGVTVRETTADDEVEIELERAYTLEIARVGVGEGAGSSDDFDIGNEKRTSTEPSNGSRLDLTWREATVAGNRQAISGSEATVTGGPSETVSLTAGVEGYESLRGGQVNFALSDPNNVIDETTFGPATTSFEDGNATVSMTIDSEASSEEEAKVFASSGDGTAVGTISVTAPDINFDATNTVSTGSGNSGIEFELENTGDEPVTLTGIAIDSVEPANPTRVNDNTGGREILFTSDGEVVGEVDTGNFDTIGIRVDGSTNTLDRTSPFEPGQTVTGRIGPFRPADLYAITDMSGQTVNMTIEYETASGTTGQQQITLEIDAPSIDSVEITASGTGNDRYDITAAVSDPNGDLSRVEFELLDTTATVVDSSVDDRIGDGTAEASLKATGKDIDSGYTIRQTVFDTAGNSKTVTRTVSSG